MVAAAVWNRSAPGSVDEMRISCEEDDDEAMRANGIGIVDGV